MRQKFIFKECLAGVLFAMLFCFFSCSTDDSPLKPTYENLEGRWYVKEVIKADGSTVQYQNLCSATPDYADIAFREIAFHYHAPDCSDSIEFCNDMQLDMGEIFNCGGSSNIFNGQITKYSATRMRIEYGQTKSFPYGDNNMAEADGVILERSAN